MVLNKMQMNDDEIETILIAHKGLVTHDVPYEISQWTDIEFVPM